MRREVMQQALEVLESTGRFLHHCWCAVSMNDYSFDELNKQIEIVDAQIAALREELDHIPDAGKMAGPVLFIHPSTLEMASAHVGAWKPGHELPGYIALYTSTPQRQPLTDEECVEAIDASFEFALASGNVSNTSVTRYARAIEAKLKGQA